MAVTVKDASVPQWWIVVALVGGITIGLYWNRAPEPDPPEIRAYEALQELRCGAPLPGVKPSDKGSEKYTAKHLQAACEEQFCETHADECSSYVRLIEEQQYRKEQEAASNR